MRLYALCDQDMLENKGLSLEEYINIAVKNSAEIIQYRNKNRDIEFTKKQLIKIRKMFNGYLIVNDLYELTDFCDGVHLGQEDLLTIDQDIVNAVHKIRKMIGDEKILGISTHNIEEILEANKMDLNYVGLGAYRDTSTKKDVSVVLGDLLDTIASNSKHSVAAIGGVELSDKFNNITYHVIGSGLVK